jgi:4'-phosphopantetheinyl transferase
MLTPGDVHVWRVQLDEAHVPPPTAAETERAARFRSPELAARYLKAHGALRAILARYTTARLDFALHEKGKPYLPMAPEVRFNLSHSHRMALVAVALDAEVGVDVEKLRPIPQYAAIADRFFPSTEDPPADEADFFRRWTRIEALLKARGVGLFDVADDSAGSWTIEPVDAGEEFAAAVAAEGTELTMKLYDYGEDT